MQLQHPQIGYGKLLEQQVTPGCRWLEVGCGRQVMPAWAMPLDAQRAMVARSQWLVGMDVDTALMEHPLLTYRVKAFGDRMPFRDESFTLVSANMVVEHVDDPGVFLTEIHRILQPGGRFVFHTSNFANILLFVAYWVPDSIKHQLVWRLERRKASDVFPTHYRMNSRSAIRSAAARAGFAVEELQFNDSIGLFREFGPVGWAEVLAGKLTSALGNGQFRSNIVCVLRRD